MMFERMLNTVPWLRNFDRDLMLRAPTLWQTRLHMAVPLALLLHGFVLGLGGLARALIFGMSANLAAGESGQYFGNLSMANSDFVKAHAVWGAVLREYTLRIDQTTVTLGLVVLGLSVLPALWVARSQGSYALTRNFGQRRIWHPWLDWLCLSLISLLFASAPLVFIWCVQPDVAQRATAQRVEAQSQAVAEALVRANGLLVVDYSVLNPQTGRRDYNIGAVMMAVANPNTLSSSSPSSPLLGSPAPSEFYGEPPSFLLPDALLPAMTITYVRSGVDQLTLVWSTQAANSPQAQAVQTDLQTSAYVQAFEGGFTNGRASPYGWIYSRFLIFWIVCLNAYVAFVRLRADAREVFWAFLLAVFVIPFAYGVYFVLINVFGSLWALSPVLYSDGRGAMLVFLLPILLLAVVCGLAFLSLLRRRAHRPAHTMAALMCPAVALQAVLLCVTLVPDFLFTSGFRDWLGVDDATMRTMVAQVLPVLLAGAPLMLVPFVGLLDRALVRDASLPVQT